MKYLLVFLLFAAVAAASAGVYTTESNCEAGGYFWCEKCSNSMVNTFGQNRCVETSIDCFYQCGTECDSNCSTSADCPINLTDTECQYDAVCSSCQCVYKTEKCLKPGSYEGDTCYYGTRSCNSNGCTISTCIMDQNETCSPDGCVYCHNDYCGNSGEYYQNYECKNDDVWAEQVKYYCNATACSYEKRDVLYEECDKGCNLGECVEGLCNMDGTEINCNEKDGFYGSNFCIGNDIYQTYRDYSCKSNQCVYTYTNVLKGSCDECRDGKCYEETENITTIIPDNTINKPPSITGPYSTHSRGTLHNGFLFGEKKLFVNTSIGGSGYFNFTVIRTNHLGNLIVFSEGKTYELGKPSEGTYMIEFDDIGSYIEFSTTTSGWFFFAPAVYDISVVVNYE